METLDIAATRAVAGPARPLKLSAVVAAPSDEPAVSRWPGWTRLAILIGGAIALWAGLAWVAYLVLKLG